DPRQTFHRSAPSGTAFRGPAIAIVPDRMTQTTNHIVVEVDGIPDREVADSMAAAIRESFRDRALAAQWHVSIRPSPVYGRWDIDLRGLDARHALSLALPETLLVQEVPRRLRESIDRLCQMRMDELRLRIVTEN